MYQKKEQVKKNKDLKRVINDGKKVQGLALPTAVAKISMVNFSDHNLESWRAPGQYYWN